MHSYIIIEYHSLDDVRKFNYSIIEEDAEIIVSSNSLYTKEEQMKIIAQFPSLIWVFNIKNGGFAYGMNEGLKIAKGDILVVMNPDVKFKKLNRTNGELSPKSSRGGYYCSENC